MMTVKGQLTHELEVGMPARVVWEEAYGTLQLSKLIVKQLPNIVQDIKVEGDGDMPGFKVYKEKFTKVDHENRAKESELVEGGYLDLGFLLNRVRFEILEKDIDSSIIRSTVEYEIAEESAANTSLLVSIEMLANLTQVVGKYLAEEYKARFGFVGSFTFLSISVVSKQTVHVHT